MRARSDHGLLAPGERWGWEYRLTVADGTGTGPAPAALDVPEPGWALAAADRYDRAVAHRVRYLQGAAGAGALAVLAVVLAVAGLPGTATLAGAAVCLAAALCCLALATVPALRAIRQADAAQRAWTVRCHGTAPTADAAPVRRDSGAGAPAAARRATADPVEVGGCVGRWRAVGLGTVERVDVYGGTERGRAALLSTVAGSILGSGGAVTVLDLTGESAARELVRLAGAAGHRLDLLSLPDHLPAVGLLSDLAPAQVGTVLAEAVHAVDRDSDSGDRSGDATLVGQAVAALRGPVTFRRLAAALDGLNGTGEDDSLAAGERANLAAAHRAPGNLAAGPRLLRLAAAASQLAELEENDPGVRPYRDSHAQLRVMQLLGDDPEQSSGLLAQVLAGVLLHQVRRQVPADGLARLLVVVGADGLRRSQLERLEALTSRRGIRLALVYRRLRADAGTPTERHAMILLRQDGGTAAGQAAALTGDRPLLTAEPPEAGRLPDPPPLPALPPHPCQATAGPARHPGTLVTPTREFFAGLPETAAVLLDPLDPGAPRLLDYDPARAR